MFTTCIPLVSHLSHLCPTYPTCVPLILLVSHLSYLYPTCISLIPLVSHLSYLYPTCISLISLIPNVPFVQLLKSEKGDKNHQVKSLMSAYQVMVDAIVKMILALEEDEGTYLHMYTCTLIHICIHIGMHVRTYICMFISTYVLDTYVHTYLHTCPLVGGRDTSSSSPITLPGCVTTLYLFSKVESGLLVNHATTIQPYLSIKCTVSKLSVNMCTCTYVRI